MSFFGKRVASPNCAAQLEAMAKDSAVIDVEQIEASGRIGGSGKSRIRAFNSSKNTVTIDVPTKAGRPITVGVDDSLQIFINSQGFLYRFNTTVREKSVFNGVGVSTQALIVEAPENLVNGNRRRHFRVTPLAASPITAEWRLASVDRKAANKRPWNKGTVHDISGRGIAFSVKPKSLEVPVEAGQDIELKLKLSLSQGTNDFTTRAVIRRVVESPDGVRDIQWSIEFQLDSRDPDAAHEKIVAYVTHCQLEAARLKRERES